MSRPGEPGRAALRRMAALTTMSLLAVAALLLQSPVGANAGLAAATGKIASEPDATPVPPAAASSARPREPGTYRLRCWQYGRLLFDESPVVLGPEARANARVVATHRNGAPLIVSDAGTSTCVAVPR